MTYRVVIRDHISAVVDNVARVRVIADDLFLFDNEGVVIMIVRSGDWIWVRREA